MCCERVMMNKNFKNWKKRINPRPRHVYEILWMDACHSAGRCVDGGDLGEYPGGTIISSIGYWVGEDGEFVYLAIDDCASNPISQHRHTTEIPKVLILQKTKLT